MVASLSRIAFRLPLLATGAIIAVLFVAATAWAQDAYRVVGVESPDVLNVRAGPSTGFPVVGTIPPGTGGIQIVGECAQRWCPISHGGLMGWVNSRFLAVEAEAPAEVEASAAGVTRAVLPDGTLELRFSDGTARRRLPNGNLALVRADGTVSTLTFLQAPGADLPPLPAEFADWGTRVNDELLSILTNILSPGELAAYQQTEQGKTFYELTSWRLRSIEFLTSPTS